MQQVRVFRPERAPRPSRRDGVVRAEMRLVATDTGFRERRVGAQTVYELDSCHSTWLFDIHAGRYLRIPKEAPLDFGAAEKLWRPYSSLAVRPNGSFVVTLKADGSRLVRAWRHIEPCPLCGVAETEEVPAVPHTDQRT